MQVGVFPLGPAPAMQAELYRREQIIRSLIRGLIMIRSQVDALTWGDQKILDYDREAKFWRAASDGKCLICGTPTVDRQGRSAADLDGMFCAKHCPVCGGADYVLEA